MSAVTQDSVEVTSTEWTLISSADVQTLQVIYGKVGLIYADAQPSASIKVKGKGFTLKQGDFFENSIGGTSWARAKNMSGAARVAVVEG